jgi:uncharacterized tellurite resistance protein B-like protein
VSEEYIAYLCPYCQKNHLQSVVTLPYVRGFLLAVQHGRKKLIGCRSCVRTQVYKETGISAAVGWFSPTALILNPIFIAYGLVRGAFVMTNLVAVRQVLKESGIPEPEEPVDLLSVAYGLAAVLIAADNKILPEEIAIASELGKRIFENFSDADFQATLDNHKALPQPEEYAAMLNRVLKDEDKLTVFRYLLAIANADNEISEEERKLLDRIGLKLNVLSAPTSAAA